MSVRLPAIVVSTLALVTAPALVSEVLAQDQQAVSQSASRLNLSVAFNTPASDSSSTTRQPEERGPSILMLALYSTTVMVQGADAHSTFAALDAGAIETNPLLGSLTSNRAAFVAFKAGVATGLIFAAKGLAKEHKFWAAALLVGVNSAHAYLAMRNYRLADRAR